MQYTGMPMGMWMLFAGSFQKQLAAVFGHDTDRAKGIKKRQNRNTRRSLQICRSLKQWIDLK